MSGFQKTPTLSYMEKLVGQKANGQEYQSTNSIIRSDNIWKKNVDCESQAETKQRLWVGFSQKRRESWTPSRTSTLGKQVADRSWYEVVDIPKMLKNQANNNRFQRRNIIKVATVKQYLNFEYQPGRAGIIPYTIIDGVKAFCLGTDHNSNDLTDFAGGVSYKKDGDAVSAAIREYTEESLSIFEPINYSDIINNICISDGNTLIIFVKVNKHPLEYITAFNEKYKSKDKSEITSILWLNEDIIKQESRKRYSIIYNRVAELLNCDFYQLL